MFKRRTLFIVGAGASAEFGLPIGSQLASTIAGRLNYRQDHTGKMEAGEGDPQLLRGIYNLRQEIGQYDQACSLIRNGVLLSSSIDDFLDLHSESPIVQRVGKAAIVKSVLQAERDSALFFDKQNVLNKMPIAKVDGTWLVKLYRVLTRGVRNVEDLFKNVAFIVFNYDRCIEHFLLHAIQQSYNVTERAAAKVLSTLTIIHPYGTAGYLPATGGSGVHFGGSFGGLDEDYFGLSDGIKTYTEQKADKGELDEIHDQLRMAERWVFLGFAYHDQNLELLKPKEGLQTKQIWGTTFQMSVSDVSVVQNQLSMFFDERSRNVMLRVAAHSPVFQNTPCSSLLDHYGKSLPD